MNRRGNADKLRGNRRRYFDVYLASTFSSINNAGLVLLPFTPSYHSRLPLFFSLSLASTPPLSHSLPFCISLCLTVCPSLTSTNRADSRERFSYQTGVHYSRVCETPSAFTMAAVTRWGRVCDRSIKPSRAGHPICLLFFEE